MYTRKLSFISLPVLLVAGGLLTGCQHEQPKAKGDLARVAAAKPAERKIQDWDTFTGQVKSKEEVQVKAQVTGEVLSVKFTEGAEVKAGQVLFEIDPSIYGAVVKQSEGILKQKQGEKDTADKDYVRVKKLFDKNNISEAEHDEAFGRKAKAAGAVLAAEGDLDRAKTNLKYCKVIAPITGQVGKALVTKGNLIRETGVTMTNIVQEEPIYAEFGVDERSLLQYKDAKAAELKGAKYDSIKDLKIQVQLGLSVETGFPHEGLIDFADNKVDPNTGTILVRAEFPNPDRKLVPGLYANIRIAVSDPYKALLVNDRALLTDQGLKYLLVAVPDEGGKYRVKRKDVVIGTLTSDGLRVIKSGLGAEDLVIVDGVQYARPEALVEATVLKEMPTLPGKAAK